MSTMPAEHKNQLRASLLELALACPVHQDNPEDCPLFRLRNMAPAERLAWFNGLNDHDLSYLASYHHVCLANKVSK